MSSIHPTSIIEPGAKIGKNVEIGPFCVVGGSVRLDDAVHLVSHISIGGDTHVGENTMIYPFASLGHPPQDLKFKGEKSRLIIGKNNVIREHVTMNPGTQGGGLLTKIGNHCLFMVATHVAHDCEIGDHVIMANNATLAGHVHVGDGSVIGGLAAVHQFVRIGAGAMIGGLSGVESDVIPYGLVMGERAGLAGLNLVGLKRRKLEREAIHALRHAFKELFDADAGTLAERIAAVRQRHGSYDTVQEILDFMQENSSRSFCTPKRATYPES